MIKADMIKSELRWGRDYPRIVHSWIYDKNKSENFTFRDRENTMVSSHIDQYKNLNKSLILSSLPGYFLYFLY